MYALNQAALIRRTFLSMMKTLNFNLYRLTIILAAILCSATSGATFKTINHNNGLPANSVNTIVQDPFGYLWLGTSNGLCRYDGVSFATFRNIPGDISSIANNNVRCISLDADGLFVGINTGLDFYSFADGTFRRCRKLVGRKPTPINKAAMSLANIGGRTFFTDTDGRLWANSAEDRMLFRIVPHKFKLYALCPCRGKNLLAANNKTLYLLANGGSRVASSTKINPGSIDKLNVSFIAYDNTIYLGSGLGYPSYAFKLKGFYLTKSDTYSPKDLMGAVEYKRSTVFATDGRGIIVKSNDGVKGFSTQNSNIGGNAIYSLFSDKAGDLWVGTYRSGLSHYIGFTPYFKMFGTADGALSFDIVTAVVARGNKLYVGLDGGGINIYDKNTHQTTKINSANSTLPGDNIVSMTIDEGYLWMAIYTKGLARYSLSSGGFDLWPMPGGMGGAENNVWCIADDGIGKIWIGGPRLYVFNKATKTFTSVHGIGEIKCSSIMVQDGHVWVSSNINGIYKINKRTRTIEAHYSPYATGRLRLPSGNIKYVYADTGNKLWFTVENVGLYSLDTKNGSMLRHGSADGLTFPLVVSIIDDKNGHLWMGTDGGGLFCYSKATSTFAKIDGIGIIPGSFTYDATAFDGSIAYMGSIDGLLTFKPSTINISKESSIVNFTELRLMGHDNHTFNLYGHESDGIKLAYDQNFFTVLFSVPEYRMPTSIRFSCRLDGLEDSWRELDGQREVSYTSIPPGHYTLYVRSTNADGRWGKPSALSITITPPWWRTVWAMTLWVLLFIAVIVVAFRIWVNEQKVKQRVRISEIESDATKRLSEAKLNFYANITHELRTPVFLIMAQLEELISERKSVVNVPSPYLQMMYRSASKLNKLITRVLDFRKMESGKLKLSPHRADVMNFCDGLVEDYVELCSQKDITFTFKHEDKPVMLDFDPEKLEIIISNLVSNAYKYTKTGGAVELSVKDEQGEVVISVKDNGIGILKNMQEAIFQNFFRTERGKSQSGGDGMGLSFVKQLVELHGGKIHVESEPDHGATFIFSIPKTERETEPQPKTTTVVADNHDALDNKPATYQATNEKKKADIEPKIADNPAALHSLLIIDDERETVNLLERSFASDFKIYKANDGEEGLEMARRHLPDIIICDLMMPKMDGMQMLAELKKDKKLQGIKVIMFTAKNTEEDKIKAFDNGVDAYITKPISIKYLRTRIDRLVAQADTASTADDLLPEKKHYNKEEQIFLLRCREIIDDNLTNQEFNVLFLADKLAMSHSALYKKVKAITGLSLIEFVNEYKVYKAVQMFKHGATGVEEVAIQCGFNDVRSFREAFKRKMGTTPKQYMQYI